MADYKSAEDNKYDKNIKSNALKLKILKWNNNFRWVQRFEPVPASSEQLLNTLSP